jgi:hypothetical protein
MTKGPCKFHLLQGACSSPVVCSAPLFLPCSLQGYRLRCLCPGRNAAWPQRAAASCFSQPRVGCGHDALQIRDLTDLRHLVGACLKPALPKQNAESAKVPDQRSTTTPRCRPSGFARARAARRAAPHPGHKHHPRRPVETARSSYGRVPLELNGRVGTGALCAPCPPLATDRVGTGRGVKLASRNDSARAPLPTLQR